MYEFKWIIMLAISLVIAFGAVLSVQEYQTGQCRIVAVQHDYVAEDIDTACNP
jgi:predicted RNA-binding protein with RPS1 domain